MKVAKKSTNSGAVKSAVNLPDANSEYAECIQHLRAAIDALGPIAKDSADARDAIADISVVLFSLEDF